MTTYTVTALTPEGETVYLDVTPESWLVITRTPIYHYHGLKLKDTVWAAVQDQHLSNVTVNEIGDQE